MRPALLAWSPTLALGFSAPLRRHSVAVVATVFATAFAGLVASIYAAVFAAVIAVELYAAVDSWRRLSSHLPLQALDNEQLRSFLKLGERSGVLLRGIVPSAPAHELLRRGDIILELEGRPVANDGTIAVSRRACVGAPIHAEWASQGDSRTRGRTGRVMEVVSWKCCHESGVMKVVS